jgi:valyl-tRNA synthetase
MRELPQQYDGKVLEKKWQDFWETEHVFAFDQQSKAPIYSVDTPPPTVSGKMHVGHSFSYAQQDFVIRYQRMKGKNVFYPFGTDDNGLATERLIEKTKGVRAKDMSRQEFVALCLTTLKNELRPTYLADFKRLGLSCDFTINYTTIDPHCQKISQREFINIHAMGRAYRKDAPAMWCPECNTGISQVECVDQEFHSTFNDIIFRCEDKGKMQDLVIATTRPELLPACVAIFYHPTDKRYHHLKGKTATVPLFNQDVPILEDIRADPEKGTGLVMCCTFGDQVDMEWQKAHNLPILQAFSGNGRMTSIAGKYEGMLIRQARKAIIEDMQKEKLLISSKPITHMVNVHERCGTEVEFIKSKQWFIKYLDLKEQMLEWGRKLNWYPDHMRNRYENWVHGLQWDWLISRQRFSGVPFPLWYCANCDEVILARKQDLPVDPLKDQPQVSKCPACGHHEFVPESDVLDTWVTSSLTPRLAIELMPEDIQHKLFPMSLRPQAHDIITFWLFNTTFRSNIHYKTNPWHDCLISGWALDPRGKKMSKSKGNIVEPQAVIEQYSADALRFWAAGSKPGEDAFILDKDYITGQKLVNKLWNASRFAAQHLAGFDGKKPHKLQPMDLWLLTKLSKTITQATESFDSYEYSKARSVAELFFWQSLCDNYLEIAKGRLYNPDLHGHDEKKSAQYALHYALLSSLKLFAPVLCHVTEEIYDYTFKEKEAKKSIHVAPWPVVEQGWQDDTAEKAGDLAVLVVGEARKKKSEQKVSLKTEIPKLTIHCTGDEEALLKLVLDDVKSATQAKEVVFVRGEELKVEF